jgi:ankyrin repeat domain-containing protein 50
MLIAKLCQDGIDCLMNALKSPETSQHFDQVKDAQKHTFEWLFEASMLEFTQWLSDDRPFYRIKGKPGSGKSTLMRFSYRQLQTREQIGTVHEPETQAVFFFHARGLR